MIVRSRVFGARTLKALFGSRRPKEALEGHKQLRAEPVQAAPFGATVLGSCPDCGDVHLRASDVHIRICDDNNTGTYSFRCPVCQMTVLKFTDERTIDQLVAGGVKFKTWRLPADIYAVYDGEPINDNDLLNFHVIINNEEALNAALAEHVYRV